MLPPPSLACAIGTMPAATAAALPPLEPPDDLERSHGFRVGPHASGSVTGTLPNSGEFERLKIIKPASMNLCTSSEFTGAMYFAFLSAILPFDIC